MILERLKRLETDVWFSFDGMTYGCQCFIDECTGETMTLHIHYCPHVKNFYKLLPKFFSKNLKCIRSEVRVYFPKRFSRELNSGQKIILETYKKPIIMQEQLHEIQMKFIDLNGISPKYEQKWKNVLSYEFKSGFEHF